MQLIICPSARLMRSIQNDIAQQQMLAGKTQWQSANIQTLTQWLDSIIEQKILCGQIEPQVLLSQLNEQILWQQVIQASLNQTSFSDLFDVAGLASAAMQANQYMVAWQLTVSRDQQAEETRQFVQWQRAFVARCRQLNVLETVRYVDWQLDVIQTHGLQANGHAPSSPVVNHSRIEFAGFDQTNPQEERLRVLLKSQGFVVAEYLSRDLQVARTKHVALENQAAECRAAVAWAKQILEDNPNAKLAIVSPVLSDTRNQLADLLDDVFYPASLNAANLNATSLNTAKLNLNWPNLQRNYNFSLGTPLSQQPMIQSGLNLLRLFSSFNWQQVDVSAVLLSPFWSDNGLEADSRALLDAKMREYLPMQFTRTQFVAFAIEQNQLLASKGFNICQLLAHIHAAESHLSNKKFSASQWSQSLANILGALNWPGDRTLSSLEYQAHNAWLKALNQLQQLDVLGSQLYQAEAVQLLQKICTDQVFQAETENTASIQILGIMEALSAPVDAMWCMGMNDHIWPPPARPNPLLPAFIQRAAKLPNADNSVQATFAAKVQQRLLHSAKDIVFSSSQVEGNSQQRPSPLMRDIECLENTMLAQTLAETLSQLGNQDLKAVVDHMAPALQVGDHVGGGTGLFRAQAICPAWAFYQYRLGAKSLKTPSSELDSTVRGTLVHDALAAFWQIDNDETGKQLRCFDDLQNMSDNNLAEALNIAIKTALNKLSDQQKTLSANLLALEHERLFKLVGDWLAFEKARGESFNMVACEADKKVIICGIEVRLKIDRIHQLEHTGTVFVDYKTGQKPSMSSWGEARITEPQLPIYAVFYHDTNKVSAVQFGMVKTAEHAYFGVGESNFAAETDPRKNKGLLAFSSWQQLLKHWQTSIEAIAEEIKAGVAENKYDDEIKLDYCEVKPLLRLPERQLQFERFKNDQ